MTSRAFYRFLRMASLVGFPFSVVGKTRCCQLECRVCEGGKTKSPKQDTRSEATEVETITWLVERYSERTTEISETALKHMDNSIHCIGIVIEGTGKPINPPTVVE